MLVTKGVEVDRVIFIGFIHERDDCTKDARRGNIETNILDRCVHVGLGFVLSSYRVEAL
ncbi:hypothetical protein D3C87_1880370 [compost metagenome]